MEDKRRRHIASLINNAAGWSGGLMSVGLVAIWLMVIAGLPSYLPLQLASWLAFLALLIAPGYLLAEIITWRLGIDIMERLALALPLGVAIMAVPGILALLAHLTMVGLTVGWITASALVLVAWLLHGIWVRGLGGLRANGLRAARGAPWATDEIVLGLLLAVAFLAIVPTLSLYKIDGDAYAVGSFAADALAGLPLNAVEPLFGTSLGPGVRMVFNQSLPMSYLWSHLATIDPITLTATASRAMLALWAIFASYALGKAAGDGSRRLGLFTAAIQLLIYLAAPFVRGDNVSLFFFERINADKFMVPVTMLPVTFAFAIRYVRDGRAAAWVAAAVTAFAVSTVHPLVAAMAALALGAFGVLHLLLHVRSRIVWKPSRLFSERGDPWLLLRSEKRSAWKRGLALLGLVALVMALPAVQLVLARSEAPLAPSYPSSLDGWPMGTKMVPVFPFVQVPSLSLYGPMPTLAQLEASQADSGTNPFLIWRFAVNMNRRRFIFFNLDRYISDPGIILEPPYLLALLLLPLLLGRLRSSVGAQFALSTALAVLFVMFNPWLTPLIGSMVMPWILWRLVWLLPYALIIALAVHRLLAWAAMTVNGLISQRMPSSYGAESSLSRYAPLGLILVLSLTLMPSIAGNIKEQADRTAAPYFFPRPERILARLNQATAHSGAVTVLADQDLSVTLPAYVAKANIVAHRAPTTSEVFPADQQDLALQRLIDQDAFYRSRFLTAEGVQILERYQVRYVITASGSDVDMQLRLSPQWFEWVLDDQSYTLYAVRRMPAITPSIQGNSALVERRWEAAEEFYRTALERDTGDWLALVGLAEVAHSQGRFDEALSRLQQIAAQVELPILRYRLGQLYAERGLIEQSIVEFDQAQRMAPRVTRFHVALGDACLSGGQEDCAATQYEAAATNQAWADDSARLIAQADLWRRRGRADRALPLYEQAAALRPSQYNQFVLVTAYREAGQFDRAEGIIRALRVKYPLSAEVLAAMAAMRAAENKPDNAIALYRYAIWLQDLAAEESVETRLLLAQLLLDINRLNEADREIARALALAPYNASAHKLQGDLYRKEQKYDEAIGAYQRAFQLDPTQVAVYSSLSAQLRQHGGQPEQIVELLRTASELNPGEATLLVALGDQLQQLGDVPSAIDAYQSALDTLDPYALSPQLRMRPTGQIRAFAYARLAAAYEDLGQITPAMTYYRAVVAAAPDVPWTYVLLGDALRRRNEADAAEANYRQAMQLDPAHLEAYIRLADLLGARGDTAEARQLYDQALLIAASRSDQPPQATDSEDLEATAVSPRPLALAFASEETIDDRATSGLARIVPSPSSGPSPITQVDEIVNAVRVLARLYQRNNQPERAIQLYQEKLQQGVAEGWSPEILAQFYKSLGDLYLDQPLPDLATQAYQQAVDLDNWRIEARLGLAEALLAQGDSAGALRQLQTAADIAPGSVEAQVALAGALDRQGEGDKALRLYQATAEAHAGNTRANLALARTWQDRHRWDQAEKSYRQALAMNAGAPEVYVGLAEVTIDLERYDEAEKLLQQAVQIDRQNVNPYLRLFDLEQRRGNSDRALTWYRQAVSLPEAGQAINNVLYDSLVRYGNYDVALAYVQEALKLRPDDGELLLRLASVQRMLARYGDAQATLTRAKQTNPLDGRVYAELAEVSLAQGQPRAALELYQTAIELSPGEAAYYLAASQLLAGQGHFAEALTWLEQGQRLVAQPTALYAAASAIHLRQAESQLALETLQRGTREVGEEPQLLIAMGRYYLWRGDFERAEQGYLQALERQPYAATLHMALGDLYLRREETDKALEHYQEAAALEPANPGAYLALAGAYRLAEQTEEAAAAYSHALALAPTRVEAHTGLAALYEEQELWDDARGVYERGLALAPASAELSVQFGRFLLGRGEEDAGLARLEQATRIAPGAATLIARAAVYADLERTEEAINDLRSALVIEPGSVDALLALGDLYRAQGDGDQARQAYEEIVSLTPGAAVGYLRLSGLANQQGDEEQAQQYVEAARQVEPGSVEGE